MTRAIRLFEGQKRRASVGLLAVLALLLCSCSKAPSTTMRPSATINTFSFRPVLCYAPPYSPSSTVAPSTPPPTSCSSPQYELIATNLSVNTATGTPQNTVNTDPALAAYPDSSAAYDDAHPRSTVILSASANSGEAGERYLLDPVGVDARQVASVQVMSEPFAGGWAVTLTLTGTGSSQWDALAQEQFHAYIAIIFDGQVISAPLTEPTQSAFYTFGGRVQIIVPNKKEADGIAAVL